MLPYITTKSASLMSTNTMSLKLDLHVHSLSNGKTQISCDQLGNSLRQNYLHGVAITNFYDISHAMLLKKQLKEYVIIVGQEVWTKDGHIIGLGLKKRIPDFKGAEETIDYIHEQGGIAVAPHPYLFNSSLSLGKKVMSLPFDAIEVYNGLVGSFIIPNYLARRASEKMKIPQVASTDTTNAADIGRTYTEVFVESPDKILGAIRSGKVKLHKRALPIPLGFIFKGFVNSSNIELCSSHAVPCLICGKSMTARIFKKKFNCLDCGKEEWSRLVCCSNEHFLCLECVVKRNLALSQEISISME